MTKEERGRRGLGDGERRQRTSRMRGKVIWLEATSADSRTLAHPDNLIFPPTPVSLLDANIRSTRTECEQRYRTTLSRAKWVKGRGETTKRKDRASIFVREEEEVCVYARYICDRVGRI